MWRRSVWAWVLVAAGILGAGTIAATFPDTPPGGPVVWLFGGLLIGATAFLVAAFIASRVTHRRWAKLSRLAHTMRGRVDVMAGRGMPSEVLRGRGSAGLSRVMLTLDSGVRIGDWEYERDWWSQDWAKTAHTWGYVVVPLPTSVPHMVLDARRGQRPHALSAGADFSRAQVHSLEGDFNDFFTVYCPAGYGADALYFLTPEIMADLIDTASGWDIEFIDNTVIFFRPGAILHTDEQGVHHLVALAARWRERAIRWAQWRDDRSTTDAVVDAGGTLIRPPVAVHDDGRRLQGGRLATTAVAALLLFIGWMYFSVVFDMLNP